MTDTPKQDLSALFPAPPSQELPPGLEILSNSLTRGLEITNLPEGIDADALITNFCAAYQDANDYNRPSAYKFPDKSRPGAVGVTIRFAQHVHYPTLMRVFADVLEGEFLQTGTPIPQDWSLNVAGLDIILDPFRTSPRPDRYSGPRFMGH